MIQHRRKSLSGIPVYRPSVPTGQASRTVATDRPEDVSRRIETLSQAWVADGAGCASPPTHSIIPLLLAIESYRMVVRGSAWPAASWTSRSGMPASQAAVMNVAEAAG